jgi:NADH-quinone oxidoreductase subunit D
LLRSAHDARARTARNARILHQAWTTCRRSDHESEGENPRLQTAVGEAYGRIEAPKGELGFYLISDGSGNPYRYRVRPPSFINLTILEDMCLGHTVADVMVILGSIDIVLGEVDR